MLSLMHTSWEFGPLFQLLITLKVDSGSNAEGPELQALIVRSLPTSSLHPVAPPNLRRPTHTAEHVKMLIVTTVTMKPLIILNCEVALFVKKRVKTRIITL